MPKLRLSQFKSLLGLGMPKDQKYDMTPGARRCADIFEDDDLKAVIATDVPRETARLIIYLLHHAHDLAEITQAFLDVTDGTGVEMLEACTGLPKARCEEIHKTFAQLID